MMTEAPEAGPTDGLRQDRILAAAERAFARHGFHRASMQDVAAEAGMSAGNLYRYFQNKDAIVSGLTERDRAALTQDFQALAVAPSFLPAIGRMLRRHLVETPTWRSRLVLEIWSEAARNPAITALCFGIESEVETHLTALVASAQAGSSELRGGDPAFAVRVMRTVVDGLFKRRATEPEFDGDAEIAMALGVCRAALRGDIRPVEIDLESTEVTA